MVVSAITLRMIIGALLAVIVLGVYLLGVNLGRVDGYSNGFDDCASIVCAILDGKEQDDNAQ